VVMEVERQPESRVQHLSATDTALVSATAGVGALLGIAGLMQGWAALSASSESVPSALLSAFK